MTAGRGDERRAAPPVGDAREDRQTLWTLAGVFAASYAMGSVLQAAYIFSVVAPGWSQISVWQRAGANAVAVASLVGALALYRQHRRTTVRELAFGVLLVAAATAVVRVLAQLAFGVYPGVDRRTTPAELLSGLVIGLVSTGAGTWAMRSARAHRGEARAAERLAVERALAVRALEDEEIRVRREVADGLHSSLQQRLVLVIAGVDDVAARLRTGVATPEDGAALDEVSAALERIRAEDVRETSRLLYPDQLELGLVPAVRAIMRRVPSSVATRLDVAPALLDVGDASALAPTERLLAVRVVEEGVANALRHGRPTSLAVVLGLDGASLTVLVEDDGGGFDASRAEPSGTRRLAERLAVVGGELVLSPDEGVGTRLSARLPVVGVVSA